MSGPAHPACVPTPDGPCSLCGDEATLARVIAIDPAAGSAEVIHEGVRSLVALDLLDEVAVGDAVLVHMGFAIGRVGGTGGA